MLPELDTYDWEEAFAYAATAARVVTGIPEPGFTREDVRRIIALAEGENDGPDWIGVFELQDGRFAALSAGCDWTGWDCQAGGSAQVASTEENIIRYGLTVGDRARLRLALPEDPVLVEA